jgi:hypothetical protein
MRDITFIWTQDWNQFFLERPELKNRAIILASFFMDFMQFLGILSFYLRWSSLRGALTMGLFFPSRQTMM